MYGACKCGQIQFEAGPLVKVVNCHCNFCRRMNGSSFSSYAVFRADGFRLETGQDLLRAYAASERATKHFCTNCGTPIYNANPTTYPGLAIVYLGTLHEHAALIPAANIYCSSKLDWVDSIANLASFPEGSQRGA